VRFVKTQPESDPLEAFFDYLGPDPVQAGEKYESLRRVLMKFFEWRGALSPDHLTDLTFDRVAGKIAAGEQIQNIHGYCQKVAYFIYLEWVNRSQDDKHEALGDDENLLPSVQGFSLEDIDDEERRFECQKRCLQEIPDENRDVIREYFAGEGRERINRREAMAVRMGISRSALGNRITRLLGKLRECERKCMGMFQEGRRYADMN
jgi:DNA-directed RNA polymerase specialized sigma24 family protein